MTRPIPQHPILVISSPSAGGKTTLRNKMLAEPGTQREFMVSYTTRMPRPDEVDGVDYHFLILRHIRPRDMLDPRALASAKDAATREFDSMVTEKDILFESTNFYGNRYGTPRQQLDDALRAGKQVVVDVNREGLDAFKATFPASVRSIFLMPPSLEVLAKRLQTRIDEAPLMNQDLRTTLMAQNAERMKQAQTTIAEASHYDHVISSAGTPQETFETAKRELARPLSPQKILQVPTIQRGGLDDLEKGRAA